MISIKLSLVISEAQYNSKERVETDIGAMGKVIDLFA